MSTITLQEIQSDPRAFVSRIEAGESMVVISHERPLAEVRPWPLPLAESRPFGLCAGQFATPDDFDAPLAMEILDAFEGP